MTVTWPRRAWTAYVAIIYMYLFLCMFRGAPFIAFDHENYIAFLDDPNPFFFEPIYTGVAYLVNALCASEWRFPIVFAVFMLPPLLVVWYHSQRSNRGAREMMIFACILTKSFYIGYITQRFFFAELWIAALMIGSSPQMPRLATILGPGMLHFSALTVLPSMEWLRSRYHWRKLFTAFVVITACYLYLRLLSGFQFFNYDYSRYLENDNLVAGFPFLFMLQVVTLGVICQIVLPRSDRQSFIVLLIVIFVLKLLFADIEVFSRIFQIQIDVIIVAAGLRCYRGSMLLFLYCCGFLILQVFFTSTATEMAILHTTAILNVILSF